MEKIHDQMMELAIEKAKKAEQMGEVPVGAVLVSKTEEILSSACNQTITLNDPTAHAEILALRKASQKLGNYRLLNSTLYVSIEPCVMCMGAIVHARVEWVVYGAPDPKWGAAGSLYDFSTDPRLNHQVKVIGGIREDECRELMQTFFKNKR